MHPFDSPSNDFESSGRHAAIARRAHALWEQQGRPKGQDLGIWLEAEADLRADDIFRELLKRGRARPEEIQEEPSSNADSDAFTPDSGSEVAYGHGRLPARHQINDS